jgi:Flp pilus assembly protein TadG
MDSVSYTFNDGLNDDANAPAAKGELRPPCDKKEIHRRREPKLLPAQMRRRGFFPRLRDTADLKQSQGLLARFLRSRSGVTMVEFALVGPLFLLLTFAIADNGLVLFMQTILDNATREAARQIEIGKVQLSGDTDGTGLFKTTLCNNLGGLIPCASLQWRVQSSTVSFASLSPGVTANGAGQMSITGFPTAPASPPQSYVLVQVGYTQPYFIPALARISGSTGNLLLVSTVALQTEHYQ